MTHKVLNLRNVPTDELDEIYALLDSHGIDFYETKAGVFGMSLPALWVRETSQYQQAILLLEQYAFERAQRAREQFAAELAEGKARTALDMFKEHPAQFVFYLALVVAMIYFSTVYFWQSWR
jgi:TRAP-type mannitol/chloroaromatic compound transport system permease small subunit